MSRSSVVLVFALLSVAVPVAAQESRGPSGKTADSGTAPFIRPLTSLTVRFKVEPDGMERFAFTTRRARRASSGALISRAQQKRSKVPIVGGMLLGAVAGFFTGDYVQRSYCEYDCGPGGFTWGFTALGAAGGAGIGLLLR